MKYFKLFENWDGESLFEAASGNTNDLKQSIISLSNNKDFKYAVDSIFKTSNKGNPINIKLGKSNVKIEPLPLLAGSGNTFVDAGVSSVSYEDIKKFSKGYDKLIITYAGKTRKIRTPYGERICQLGTPDNELSETYLGRIYTLYLAATQIRNIELLAKVAPGIGYEEMQVNNLDEGLASIFKKMTKRSPLQLYINDKNMGVKIDGGAKVSGVPKSDLAFGIKGKPNFWISYKHGEYINDDGTVDKVSFQQYGSISSFFNKKFDSALSDVKGVRGILNSFFGSVRRKIMELEGSGSASFKGVTDFEVIDNYTKARVVHEGGETILENIPKGKLEELSKNESSLKNEVKRSGPVDLTILYKDGFSARKSILDLGPIGKEITMLSIFGIDYGKSAGKENVNVLMQDAQPFGIKLRLGESGNAEGVDITTSGNGHVMFNPKLYGETTNPPTFMEKYEPYFVARYTGGNRWYWNEGGKATGIIGIRSLIMPKYHSKDDTDV